MVCINSKLTNNENNTRVYRFIHKKYLHMDNLHPHYTAPFLCILMGLYFFFIFVWQEQKAKRREQKWKKLYIHSVPMGSVRSFKLSNYHLLDSIPPSNPCHSLIFDGFSSARSCRTMSKAWFKNTYLLVNMSIQKTHTKLMHRQNTVEDTPTKTLGSSTKESKCLNGILCIAWLE